jgi:hypothetical protein
MGQQTAMMQAAIQSGTQQAVANTNANGQIGVAQIGANASANNAAINQVGASNTSAQNAAANQGANYVNSTGQLVGIGANGVFNAPAQASATAGSYY